MTVDLIESVAGITEAKVARPEECGDQSRILCPRFEEALVYAAQLHADLLRKGTNVPYIHCPLARRRPASYSNTAARRMRPSPPCFTTRLKTRALTRHGNRFAAASGKRWRRSWTVAPTPMFSLNHRGNSASKSILVILAARRLRSCPCLPLTSSTMHGRSWPTTAIWEKPGASASREARKERCGTTALWSGCSVKREARRPLSMS